MYNGAVTPGPSRECGITFFVKGRPKSARQSRDSTVAERRVQSVTVPSSRVSRECRSPGLRSPPFKNARFSQLRQAAHRYRWPPHQHCCKICSVQVPELEPRQTDGMGRGRTTNYQSTRIPKKLTNWEENKPVLKRRVRVEPSPAFQILQILLSFIAAPEILGPAFGRADSSQNFSFEPPDSLSVSRLGPFFYSV